MKAQMDTLGTICVFIVLGLLWFRYGGWLLGLLFWGPLAFLFAVVVYTWIRPRGPDNSSATHKVSTSQNIPIERPSLGLILKKIDSNQALTEHDYALVAPIVLAAKNVASGLQANQRVFLQLVDKSVIKKVAAGVQLSDIELEFSEARSHRRLKQRTIVAASVLVCAALIGALLWRVDSQPASIESPDERSSARTTEHGTDRVPSPQTQQPSEGAVDCYALSKYAEAQGHSWMEKSLIVSDAEKRGACTWDVR